MEKQRNNAQALVIQSAPPRHSMECLDGTDDNTLVDLFQAGELPALEKLMTRHRGIVWRVVKQYLGSLMDAEDMFQDILLHLIQNPQSFQLGGAKFSSWLYRVATNRCLDVLRAKSSSAKHGDLDESIPSDLISVEDDVARKEVRAQIQGLLAELPQQQKTAICLYYYDDMAIEDISLQLSLSHDATRSLIKRGKAKLRDMSSLHLV